MGWSDIVSGDLMVFFGKRCENDVFCTHVTTIGLGQELSWDMSQDKK